MPVERISKPSRGRDALLSGLLGEVPQAEAAADAPLEAKVEQVEPAAVVAPQPEPEPEPEPAQAQPRPLPRSEPSPKEPPVVRRSPKKPNEKAASGWTADERLKPRAAPTERVLRVQLANRIRADLKDRLDRHCQRTGESITSVLERVLDLAMEVSEAEAGVDANGDPT